MDHARRGEAALTAKNNAEAIEHYTAAIAQAPSAAPYYVKRSTAYQRSQKYAEALEDANIAVTLAFKRAKRELIAQAQLRRGIALFNLQKYGDAKACFGWAKKFDEKEKLIGIWDGQVDGKLRGLPEGDEKAVATIAENPNTDAPVAATQTSTAPSSSAPVSAGSTSTAAPVAPAQTPADKIRHEWYQNTNNVYVTLLAKGVPKEKASVDIEEQSLSISFLLVTGSSFDFSLDPLYAPVDTSASSFKILSTKIEITLKKVNSGQKWPALEGTSKATDAKTGGTGATNGGSQASTLSKALTTTTATKATAPSYPTSSRSGPKNWDQIANSYTKPPPAKKQDSKASEGDDEDGKSKAEDDIYVDDFEDGGDEVNAFFKKLYAGASDETKRAMMKSYQESGGTALSTNWDEVKKGPVPVSPPDGMEAKEWER